MAKLTYKQRKALPTSDFAVVQKKKGKTIKRFPINDKAHARNALARLPQAKGLSAKEKSDIRAKADKKLDISPTERRMIDIKKRQRSS